MYFRFVYLISFFFVLSTAFAGTTVKPAPSTTPVSSWLGNSFSSSTTAGNWVQEEIDASFIAEDGTVYTNGLWDEGGHEGGIYKDGQMIGALAYTHGFGRGGSHAITAESKYVYMAITQASSGTGTNAYGKPNYPPSGTIWYGVRRYNLSGGTAGFTDGYIGDASMLVVNTSKHIRGLAAGDGYLFVSDPSANEIKIYNSATMSQISSIALTAPGPLAFDSFSKSVWAVQTTTGQITHYAETGSVLPEKITSIQSPTALAVNNRGWLMVADNGPDQNVKIFNSIETSPVYYKSVGVKGGEFGTTPGVIGPTRFGGLTGVGTDANGNTYITMNGNGPIMVNGVAPMGTNIRAFNSAGTLTWRLFNNEFVSTGVIDPMTDGADVYTENVHYKLDLTKPVGQEAVDYAITQNPLKYSTDPRTMNGNAHTYPVGVRYIDGKKFLFMSTMYQDGILIYRFDGEIAVPSGWIQASTNPSAAFPPQQPSTNWIWRDLNGNGIIDASEYGAGDLTLKSQWAFQVDDAGNIWAAGPKYILKYPVQGLDSLGNPIYSQLTSKTYSLPGQYTSIQRLHYVPATDTMYVSGFFSGQSAGSCWGSVGPNFTRFDKFTSGTPAQTWQIALPFDCGVSGIAKAFDIAGNAIFVQDAGPAGKGALGPGVMTVYDANTGKKTIAFYPGSAVGGQTYLGWTDIPYAVHAYSLSNGTYLVFTEDDVHGKVLMYYWK